MKESAHWLWCSGRLGSMHAGLRRRTFHTKAVLVLLSLFVLLASLAQVEAHAVAGAPVVNSTAQDRTHLTLAIYDNQALVSETRKMALPKGRAELVLGDVPGTIDPSSLQILPQDKSASLRILQQNYNNPSITEAELIRRSIGKTVTLMDKERRVKARLLAPGIYEIEGEVYIGPQGVVVLPKLPEGLVERPVLSCLVESMREQDLSIEVSYLAAGIAWRGSYAATVAEDEQSLALQGWVSIKNNSGADYKNARVSIVAGSPHSVKEEPFRPELRAMKLAGAMEAGAEVPSVPAFEYHVYSLPETVSIQQGQDKQVSLLSAPNCKMTKRFVFDWAYHMGQDEEVKDSAKVFLRLDNSESSGLGTPLPQGKVRAYKRLKDQLLFLGEDKINNVPIDEKFELFIGQAFDVTGKKKRTAFRSMGREGEEASFHISVANRKKEDVTVVVVETAPGDWKIIEATHKYTWVTSNKVEFELLVEANEEKTLEYSVRINRRW